MSAMDILASALGSFAVHTQILCQSQMTVTRAMPPRNVSDPIRQGIWVINIPLLVDLKDSPTGASLDREAMRSTAVRPFFCFPLHY